MRRCEISIWLGVLLLCAMHVNGQEARPHEMDLSGTWAVALDRDDVGVDE